MKINEAEIVGFYNCKHDLQYLHTISCDPLDWTEYYNDSILKEIYL